METYLRDVVDGCHYSQKIGLNLARVAWMTACWNRWFARVWGLGDDGVDC